MAELHRDRSADVARLRDALDQVRHEAQFPQRWVFFVGELHEDSVGHRGCIGIMEKKMETTGIIGVI